MSENDVLEQAAVSTEESQTGVVPEVAKESQDLADESYIFVERVSCESTTIDRGCCIQ